MLVVKELEGDRMDVLSPALSSTIRPKTHLRGKKPKSATSAIDAFACNEVRLLVTMLASRIKQVARAGGARDRILMEPASPA